MNRAATSTIVDYQQRARQFAVGDVVVVAGEGETTAGRVTAVWPAIGMLDVEYPSGGKREAVEDMQKLDKGTVSPPKTETVPGGAGTVIVARVAQAFVKKALYWGAKDRQYRATSEEITHNKFSCPKCRKAELRKAIYKRKNGQSEHLLGCPDCLFLIERDSLLNLGAA